MRMWMFASILFLLSLGVASAQIAYPVVFTMDTAFVAGNTTFPAGSYEIRPTDDQSIVEIQSEKGAPEALFEVEPLVSVTPFKQTEVVFNKYGDNLVLKEVAIAGQTTGVTTVTTHLEKRHRKAFGKPTRVRHPAKRK
jgi:hypothetical protein